MTAGTSDIPVAEEAAVTAEILGNRIDRIYDVGVAGIHRVLAQHERLSSARAVIVVAGMEGALPSVVAGMVGVPVIGVPTSIGYGASFGGVAGLHRLLSRRAVLDAASVVIVVAGMEGALASVVGGLTAKPVIAVPTSIGYGASFGGIAALLSMLNSCASGVTVVNIDNGFGAAYAATLMNRAGA